MKVLVLGSQGYIGWALAHSLIEDGHEVVGLDNYSRDRRVRDIGSSTLMPRWIDPPFREYRMTLGYLPAESVGIVLEREKPEAIFHLAEQPSAPWSMKNEWTAYTTQVENVLGTLDLLWAIKEFCPDAHLIKIGTMGEYGTPNCDIPEGIIPYMCMENDEIKCPMAGLMFPRTAGSWYHLSKVHDTHNIFFACANYGLRSTDIMQGVVYGNEYNTRFDYDEHFGTAINRFCAQALVEHPLTVYGSGNQRRGFLPLKDSIQCLKIAMNNPPKDGEYRTWNQFEFVYKLNDLAEVVQECAREYDLDVEIDHIENPRNELNDHYYNPSHNTLYELGYEPTTDIKGEIHALLGILYPYRENIIKGVIAPKTKWR